MPEFDLSKPQRQSVVGVVVIFLKNLRKAVNIIFSIFLVQFSLKSDAIFLEIGVAVVVLITLLFSILIYRNFLFYVEDDEFIIDKGLFRKEKIAVPFERIQSVHIDQNVVQRILRVVGLKIDTAGSVDKEMEIAALPDSYARSIQEFLIKKKNKEISRIETEKEGVDSTIEREEPMKALIQLSLLDVLKVGITENHLKTSLALFALINGYFWQSQNFFMQLFQEYVGERQEVWLSQWLILVPLTFAFLLLVSIGLSIVLSVLKYYGLQFMVNKKEIQKVSGLLKRTEYQIPITKIQLLKYSSNPLRKIFGLKTLVIKQASSKASSDKQSLMIPGCNQMHLDAVLKEFFPELNSSSLLTFKAHTYLKVQMIILFAVLPSFIIGLLSYFEINFLGLAVFWLLLSVPLAYQYASNMYMDVGDEVLRLRKGWLFPKTELVKYYKLQSVALRQNIFQKRRNIAHLDFYTAAGSLRMWQVDADLAHELYDYILYKIEESDKNWM